jgi:hypothetical protein
MLVHMLLALEDSYVLSPVIEASLQSLYLKTTVLLCASMALC